MRLQPERLVFINETSIKTNMTKTRRRAPMGERLHAAALFGPWSTQTFIAGLTAASLIAPWIIPGEMNREAVATYVETQLAPAIAPGTVVIPDNLSTHKNARAAKALHQRDCWFLWLPPYAPDFDPIEMAFSNLKQLLLCVGARTFDQPMQALSSICDLFTPDQCPNYLTHAGYVSK